MACQSLRTAWRLGQIRVTSRICPRRQKPGDDAACFGARAQSGYRGAMLELLAMIATTLSANAFWISEHEALTKVALARFHTCHPEAFSPKNDELLISANLDEDRNVLRKWITYSHFFSPHHDLDQRRRTSLDRVTEIEAQFRTSIEPGSWSAYRQLGVVMHHVQDSAVPAHVVPVSHWLSDGFEAYEAHLSADPGACDEDETSMTLSEILIWSAEHTLGAVGAPPWNRFWIEPDHNGFGSYGPMGNAFGDPKIWSAAGYREFKLGLLRQATRATRMVLGWFTRNKLPHYAVESDCFSLKYGVVLGRFWASFRSLSVA